MTNPIDKEVKDVQIENGYFDNYEEILGSRLKEEMLSLKIETDAKFDVLKNALSDFTLTQPEASVVLETLISIDTWSEGVQKYGALYTLALEKILYAIGFDVDFDGEYDFELLENISRFQVEYGDLKTDGDAGGKTIIALLTKYNEMKMLGTLRKEPVENKQKSEKMATNKFAQKASVIQSIPSELLYLLQKKWGFDMQQKHVVSNYSASLAALASVQRQMTREKTGKIQGYQNLSFLEVIKYLKKFDINDADSSKNLKSAAFNLDEIEAVDEMSFQNVYESVSAYSESLGGAKCVDSLIFGNNKNEADSNKKSALRVLQFALKKLGLYDQKIDGKNDVFFMEAIDAFYAKLGLGTAKEVKNFTANILMALLKQSK